MEELVSYFMEETNRKLDRMEAALTDLQQFRVSLIAQSRLTALIVSAICGFISLLASVGVVLWVGK